MPHNVPHHHYIYKVFSGFEHLVFVFYFQDNSDIWILNLLNKKWYKSPYDNPKSECYDVYILKGKCDRSRYIMDFRMGNRYKFDLYNLLPLKLIKDSKDYYELLIIGWIKEMENNDIIPSIPIDLQRLILYFFSIPYTSHIG